MERQRFIYVAYIAATPEELWDALLTPAMTRQYWEHDNVSDWRPGSRWEHRRLDAEGTVDVAGRVVEAQPPHRLVLTWGSPGTDEETMASRVTFEIEPLAEAVRLRLTHDGLAPEAFSQGGGWPAVLSSLKTLLETGKPLRRVW